MYESVSLDLLKHKTIRKILIGNFVDRVQLMVECNDEQGDRQLIFFVTYLKELF
jgi:hypothetical protein